MQERTSLSLSSADLFVDFAILFLLASLYEWNRNFWLLKVIFIIWVLRKLLRNRMLVSPLIRRFRYQKEFICFRNQKIGSLERFRLYDCNEKRHKWMIVKERTDKLISKVIIFVGPSKWLSPGAVAFVFTFVKKNKLNFFSDLHDY